jgi:hypothetical protein
MKCIYLLILIIIFLSLSHCEEDGYQETDELKEMLIERLKISTDPSEKKFLEAALTPQKYDSDQNGLISRDELFNAIHEIFFSTIGINQLNGTVREKMRISIRNYVNNVKPEMSFVEMSEFIIKLQPHTIFNMEDIINSQKHSSDL